MARRHRGSICYWVQIYKDIVEAHILKGGSKMEERRPPGKVDGERRVQSEHDL
jgi:hypothetical protein